MLKNKIPVRGRKLFADSSSQSSVTFTLKNKIPVRGRKLHRYAVAFPLRTHQLKNKIPVRGRKRKPHSVANVADGVLVEKQNPRKGTETLKRKKFGWNLIGVEKQNPRKGTETFLVKTQMATDAPC